MDIFVGNFVYMSTISNMATVRISVVRPLLESYNTVETFFFFFFFFFLYSFCP